MDKTNRNEEIFPGASKQVICCVRIDLEYWFNTNTKARLLAHESRNLGSEDNSPSIIFPGELKFAVRILKKVNCFFLLLTTHRLSKKRYSKFNPRVGILDSTYFF